MLCNRAGALLLDHHHHFRLWQLGYSILLWSMVNRNGDPASSHRIVTQHAVVLKCVTALTFPSFVTRAFSPSLFNNFVRGVLCFTNVKMLVSLLSPVALMGAFASTVLAHGNIVWFKSDGITNPGLLWNYWFDWYCYDKPYLKLAAWFCNDSGGFVSLDRFNTSDINCYPEAVPAPLTAKVKAGETVTFHY